VNFCKEPAFRLSTTCLKLLSRFTFLKEVEVPFNRSFELIAYDVYKYKSHGVKHKVWRDRWASLHSSNVWLTFILQIDFHLQWVILYLNNEQLPIDLIGSGGSKPFQSITFRPSYATQVAFETAMITASLVWDLKYIYGLHILYINFHLVRAITDPQNGQLLVGLRLQMVQHCTWIAVWIQIPFRSKRVLNL